MEGFIVFFDPVKGFGVVRNDDLGVEYKFLKRNSPSMPSTPRHHQRVTFQTTTDPKAGIVACDLEPTPYVNAQGKPIIHFAGVVAESFPVATPALTSALHRLSQDGFTQTLSNTSTPTYSFFLLLADLAPNYEDVLGLIDAIHEREADLVHGFTVELPTCVAIFVCVEGVW